MEARFELVHEIFVRQTNSQKKPKLSNQTRLTLTRLFLFDAKYLIDDIYHFHLFRMKDINTCTYYKVY